MHRGIVSITLNPSIDVTLRTDGLHYERTNRVLEETHGVGGKGINVSRVVQEFGQKSLCISVAGKENCREFAGYLDREKLQYELIRIEGAVRENLTLRCNGQTIKVNRKGPPMSVMMMNALMELVKSRVNAGDIVVFAGSLPENVSVRHYIELILAVKSIGALIAVDSDMLTLEDYKIISPWLIKPNIHELGNILNVNCDSIDDVTRAADLLCENGVQNVLVSLGEDGMVFTSKTEKIRAVVPKVEVKSAVGAGDSSLAGFIVGFVKGYDVKECVRLAAACGTASAMKEGTILTDRLSAEKIAREIILDGCGTPLMG